MLAELRETFARYAASLGSGAAWLVVFAGLVALFGVAVHRGLPPKHHARITLACVAIAALFAVIHAWRLRWIGDDAFISFRYADNWANGKGLVFNAGEKVEGYTNFLWTAILTLGVVAGAHPAVLSVVLTLASLAGSIALGSLLARRLLPPGAPLPGVLAGAALAANYSYASFGTSGLETVPAALLMLLAVERAVAGATLVSASAGILAALAHPDHILLYAGLGLAIALAPGPRVRRVALYAAPLFGLFVPYYLARFAYYGDFFPNTYYAKSGGAAYFSQGFAYVALSALASGFAFALPLAVWGAFRRRSDVFGRYVLIALPLYLAYVAKVGGDFMFGRLLCVTMPPLLVSAELAFRELVAKKRWKFAVPAGVALTLPAVPNGIFRPQEDFHAICDERTWYPLTGLRPVKLEEEFSYRTDAMLAAFAQAPRPPRVGFCCVGIMGYRTGYPLLDMFGLTSREIAHMPIRKRGRTGHEKMASPGHVFAFDADFASGPLWPSEQEAWAKLRIGGFEYTLAKYDPVFFAGLRKSEATDAPDIERMLRDYSASGKSPERLACDLWFFDQLYFSHGGDGSLRQAFTARLVEKVPEWAGIAGLLTAQPAERYPGFRARRRFDFEDFRGFSVRGKAFGDAPASSEALGQARVYGQRGRFANSYHPSQGDAPTGTLISEKFTLEGDALTFRIGGGAKRGREEVRLLVDGRSVRNATGCDSEVLGRRVFSIAEFRGREAQLEIVDKDRGNWGHVVVDEVIEWSRSE
ncbi:MAG TPA: hypothetical protein VGK73_16545 [Polyangiaceae bacterium]